MSTFAAQTFSKSDDLGVRTDDFLGEGGFLDFNFRSAYLAGEEVVQEQERDFASQDVKPPKKGSASSLHAKFNKRRKGVAELTQKALQAVAGAEEFAKGNCGRHSTISDSFLTCSLLMNRHKKQRGVWN